MRTPTGTESLSDHGASVLILVLVPPLLALNTRWAHPNSTQEAHPKSQGFRTELRLGMTTRSEAPLASCCLAVPPTLDPLPPPLDPTPSPLDLLPPPPTPGYPTAVTAAAAAAAPWIRRSGGVGDGARD